MDTTRRLDELQIIHPDHYVEHGYPHAEWAQMRREAQGHHFGIESANEGDLGGGGAHLDGMGQLGAA